MEWNNMSVRKCVCVADIMSELYDARGHLPDNKTPEMLRKTTADELMEFGQKVASDDALWSALPEHIVPSENKKKRMKETATRLSGMKVISADGSTIDEIIAEAEAGKSRDKLRQLLRQTLDQSR